MVIHCLSGEIKVDKISLFLSQQTLEVFSLRCENNLVSFYDDVVGTFDFEIIKMFVL